MSRLVAVFALVLCSQVFTTNALISSPCKVAETILKLGLSKENAARFVCLAKAVSGFNTQALSREHKDGSYDFGIFQINDKYCRLGSKESCGVPCTDLVGDDIFPSAKCAVKLFQKHAFKLWPAWRENCQNIDTSRFIVKCSLGSSKRSTTRYSSFIQSDEVRRLEEINAILSTL